MDKHERRGRILFVRSVLMLFMIVQHVLHFQTLERVEPNNHGVLTSKAPSSSCIVMSNDRF